MQRGSCKTLRSGTIQANRCRKRRFQINSGGYEGYIYDAAGNRVAKGTIQSVIVMVNGQQTLSCDTTVNGFVLASQYLLGPSGEQMTELNAAGTWVHTNVTANGSLLATFDNDNNGAHFYLTDWLGSKRIQTNYLGAVEETCQSLPYGDALDCFGPVPDATEQHFTGKERDAESGNDYFLARYYSSAMGRFMSPDWSAKQDPVPYAKLDNPQSLNLYAYVMNNPMTRIDADGHSYLVYDNNTNTITLYSKDGAEIGHWDANNNVAIHDKDGGYTKGPVQDGTYDVQSSDASGSGWGHAGDSSSSYGKDGIAHVDDMVGATGETMSGAGVHSGHDDDTTHVTYGCVRTTDGAMDQIKTTAKTDKLTTLEVQNNKANGDAWLKQKAAAEKAAAKAKAKNAKPQDVTEQQ
jgi:RHS repeat-associated protein